MRKKKTTYGIIDEIGDLASDIDSGIWDVEDAVSKIKDRLGELKELKESSGLAWSMTIDEMIKMIKLYRRMRQAQKEGDDTLVDFILEQIDTLLDK